MSLFTTLDTQRLCQEIGEAKHHVIYAAPGLTSSVANALTTAGTRLGKDQVAIVLDVSTQVAHLGYGEFDPITKLKGAGMNVRDHRGLRLSVLICDNHGWTFAIAPKLVEADPTADTDAFNAIALTEAQIIALRVELPPLGPPRSDELPPVVVVGEHSVSPGQMTKVASDLRVAPPRDFDLARRINVYTAMLQFVELELEGFNLGSREVRLPASLPLLATENENLRARITSSLRILGKTAPPRALAEIKAALEQLRKKYLKPVGKAGRVILKRELPEFEDILGKIEAELEKCRMSLIEALQKSIDDVITAIANELAKSLLDAPPLALRIMSEPPTMDDAVKFAQDELRGCFPNGEKLVGGLRIHKYYKDVTLESLRQGFGDKLKSQLPADMKDHPLVIQLIAAGEKKPVPG